MISKFNAQIGERIRNGRTALNMSIEEFAKKVGLTPGYLGLIEGGHRSATASILCNITNVLNMSLDELFKDMDEVNPLIDEINAYFTYLNEDDLRHILEVCKSLRRKNEETSGVQ